MFIISLSDKLINVGIGIYRYAFSRLYWSLLWIRKEATNLTLMLSNKITKMSIFVHLAMKDAHPLSQVYNFKKKLTHITNQNI
jgi:hypothetical protein